MKMLEDHQSKSLKNASTQTTFHSATSEVSVSEILSDQEFNLVFNTLEIMQDLELDLSVEITLKLPKWLPSKQESSNLRKQVSHMLLCSQVNSETKLVDSRHITMMTTNSLLLLPIWKPSEKSHMT